MDIKKGLVGLIAGLGLVGSVSAMEIPNWGNKQPVWTDNGKLGYKQTEKNFYSEKGTKIGYGKVYSLGEVNGEKTYALETKSQCTPHTFVEILKEKTESNGNVLYATESMYIDDESDGNFDFNGNVPIKWHKLADSTFHPWDNTLHLLEFIAE